MRRPNRLERQIGEQIIRQRAQEWMTERGYEPAPCTCSKFVDPSCVHHGTHDPEVTEGDAPVLGRGASPSESTPSATSGPKAGDE